MRSIFLDTEDMDAAIRYVVIECESLPEQYEQAKKDRKKLKQYDFNRQHIRFVMSQIHLEELTDYEMNILHMKYELRYTFEEIAKIIGFSNVHTRRILHRILEKLCDAG